MELCLSGGHFDMAASVHIWHAFLTISSFACLGALLKVDLVVSLLVGHSAGGPLVRFFIYLADLTDVFVLVYSI